MKRLIVFIFIVVLLCLTNLPCFKEFKLDSFFPESNVEVYLGEYVDMGDKKLSYIKNGDGMILFMKIEELELFLKENNVLGYTIYINHTSVNTVFELLNVKNVDYKNNSFYGESNLFSKSLNVDGMKYNFQCVKKEESILLGTPILLGSY